MLRFLFNFGVIIKCLSKNKLIQKDMKLLSSIFQTKMFLVTLILLIIYSFIIAPTGFNRTISWGEFDKLIYFTKTYFQIILIFTCCVMEL